MSANLPIQPPVARTRPSVKPAGAAIKKATATAGPPAASRSTLVSPLTTPPSDLGTTEMTAKAAPISEAVSPVATKSPYRDGSYSGWGSSRHGDIEATVVIEDGRITSATITRCLTRYSCSWIAHLPGQVVSRQSADVDYVSGATQSTDAFYYAVVDALSKAKGEALSKAKG
jgi:uncharacterized protein with FMN-binding domain